MPYIEIKTVHNVIVAYETATWNERAFALFIDCLVIAFAYFILSIILGLTGQVNNNVLVTILSIPLIFIYHLLSENFTNGQSLGKKATGLKVVKLTGREVTFQDYFIRWVFRLTDILFSFGSLAVILISSSAKGQRLGDILANTVVVKIKQKKTVHLKDITTLTTFEHYEPRYKEAAKLNEEQALLIKTVLDRKKNFPGDTSNALATELRKKLINELSIQEVRQNAPDFLSTILKDYVVLTR